MKNLTILTTLLLSSSISAFTPSTIINQNTISNTRLYISSWGRKGPPSRQKQEEDPDPERKIQSYLKAPEPIMARSNLDGTALVSGWVNSKDRTDQTVFDFLNSEESAFKFQKIVAFVDDAKFAKKRLISRSARYTGLLSKLDFLEAESVGALPTADQLKEWNVKSWVANTSASDSQKCMSTVKNIVSLANQCPSVENVSILITDAHFLNNVKDSLDAIQSVSATTSNKSFSIVAVGAMKETPEGSMPYQIRDFGSEEGLLPMNATYSRDESLRLVTECLGLESTKGKYMVFSEVTNVNQTEAKLVRGLREGGYTRPQEIEHMISKGPKAYEQAIADYKVRVPKRTPQDEWLAQKQRELDENAAERKVAAKAEFEAKKKQEIEDIAREWAKREYFRQSMAGDMPYSEEEYIQSVWDRALFEGDLKYRMLRGQETDERKELADFKKKQEKKKAMMLERAKASLKELLDEDDSSVATLTSADDDDEEDDEE